MTKMEINKPQPVSVLDFEKTLLYYSGFYPLKKSKLNFLYKIASFATIAFSTSFLICMAVRLYLDRGNIPAAVEASYFLMTQTAFLCKFFPFIYQLSKLYEMEAILQGEIFNSQRRSQDVFITDGINNYKLFARVFRYSCILVVSFFAIVPIVDNQLLPVPAWFPLDPVEYRVYLIGYQFLCFFMNAYNNSCVDCITAALISMASAQFEILKENLTHVSDGIAITEKETQKILKDRLRKCIIHHNAIFDFVGRIEDMFSGGMFFQFLSSIVIFCLTGIQFTVVSPTSFKFLSLVLYFFTISNQVVICCWFGHDILIKSSGVGQACYMSNWYECSPENLKIIFIIMERAKRPVVLTAGKFFTLSLMTFVMIMRSAYSYFAVLQRVYRKE